MYQKHWGGSIADIYITGRVFNLLGYILLMVLTLKTLPYKKYIVYSMFFMPMLLALASVYSPDGIGTALVALFIAYCLKLHEKKEVSIKEVSILLLLLILATFIKSVGYVGIVLIIFVLPLKNIIKQNKRYMKYIITLLIILLIGILVIYKININAPGDARVEGTDTRAQFEHILNDPFNYGKILVSHTIGELLDLRAVKFLNAPMFFRTTNFNVFIILMEYLFFISITDSTKHLKIKHRILFILTFFIIYAMTTTAMYLSYTSVGANYINGHQLRYIFPTISLILMSISIKKLGIEKRMRYSDLYIAYPMAIFLMISALDLTII